MIQEVVATKYIYNYMNIMQSRKIRTPKKEDIYGAIIKCSRTGRYLLVLGREAMKWSFPKGHAREGETPFKCLIREVYEETGFIDLPPPIIRRQLRVGEYYEFIIPEEFSIRPVDSNEIVEGKWMSLHDISLILMNIDTSHYFRELGITPIELTETVENTCIGNLINLLGSESEIDEDCDKASQLTEDPC